MSPTTPADGVECIDLENKGGALFGSVFGQSREAEATAKLIVAAPDMLEVLKTIENDGKQVPPWLWDRIQAAIAKAEGREARS